MQQKNITLLSIGAIFAALGLLWVFQGLDLIRLQPILCFTNCEIVSGQSPLWQLIGITSFFTGLILIFLSLRRKNEQQ